MPSHVRAYLTHQCALQIDITDITYYVIYSNTQWVMMNICDCVCTVVIVVMSPPPSAGNKVLMVVLMVYPLVI